LTVCRMIELQRRLAQDYQRQREMELNRQMAQTGIRDNTPSDQTVLVRRADVDRYGSGSPRQQQTGSPASRDLQAADRAYIMDHVDQMHPRSVPAGQQVVASWPQSDITGTGGYGDYHDRQQSARVKPMPVGHISATMDDFVQQLKSCNAK